MSEQKIDDEEPARIWRITEGAPSLEEVELPLDSTKHSKAELLGLVVARKFLI